MADKDIALMAHLMRRAGFGATYDELEARVAKGYEATVEELLQTDQQPEMERDLMMRYQPQWFSAAGLEGQQEDQGGNEEEKSSSVDPEPPQN